jgi:acetyl-CoA carboxylase biotin carboxyl carrier protein
VTDAAEPEPQPTSTEPSPATAGVSELIALIDRLEPLLGTSGLDEIEIAAGATALVLRAPARPSAVAPAPAAPAAAPDPPSHGPSPAAPAATTNEGGLRQVTAPLTGVFYLSPSPGAAPYVKVGGEVIAGQVIGLLEAMKLFNEIKSDVTGVVRAIVAESGALVKTHQVLIEVEPT